MSIPADIINQVHLQTRRFLRILYLVNFLFATSICIFAQDNLPFNVGSVAAKSGETVTGSIIIEPGVDEGTFIPITIINGAQPGPVLTLFAGIHGTEYVPILTLQELINEIDPAVLSGSLIIVHVANIPAFSHRNVYYGQMDGKNLNRVFPGKEDGTISERIAYALTNEVLKKSDYFIDLHGGEFNEKVVDYVYFYYGCPEGDICDKSRMMAHATGNRYLIPSRYDEVHDSVQATYSDVVAFRLGLGAISNEWGDLGMANPGELETARRGIINVMRTLKMLEGKAFVNSNPVYLLDEKYLTSSYNGIFYPLVDKGQFVAKGTLLGYTTDYWGNVLEEYHSPYTGIVVTILNAPAINKGDNASRVARAVDEFEE